ARGRGRCASRDGKSGKCAGQGRLQQDPAGVVQARLLVINGGGIVAAATALGKRAAYRQRVDSYEPKNRISPPMARGSVMATKANPGSAPTRCASWLIRPAFDRADQML